MKKGFTLIEMLIALVIIGAVLVLTVPQFITSFNKKTYSAGIQKMYIAVDQAVKQMMADERASAVSRTTLCNTGADTVENTAGAFLKKYFAIETDCGTKMKPCFADSYRNAKLNDITAKIEETFDNHYYCVKVTSGGAICLKPLENKDYTQIYVDINGSKSPNVMGRDLFYFKIYDDGFVGERTSRSSAFSKLKNNNWEMDY